MADGATGGFIIRAEEIIHSGYQTENVGVAEDGKLASLFPGQASQGELRYTHTGEAGLFDLILTVFDEADGQGSFDVLVNGELVFTYQLDQLLGSNWVNNGNRVNVQIEGLELSSGDVVSIVGYADAGEWVRIDTLEFTPVGPPPPPPEPAPPTGDLADVNVALDAPFIIDLDEHFSDINGDALTYSISGPGAAYASLDGSTLTINASVEGDFGLTVIANDGAFDSAPVAFTFSVADVPPEPISIEAEDIIASGFVVENHGATSQGQVASLLNSGNSQGELSYTFEGGAGTYDLSVIAHDENDGVGSIDVLVNGEIVQTFTLDGSFPSGAIADNNRVSLDVEALGLNPGDEIQIIAVQGGGEWMRIDTLEFTPVGPPPPPPEPAPPTGDLADVNVALDAPFIIDLDEHFSDINGDALTYSISGPGAAYASLDGSTLTINASVEGDFGLTVIANDGTFDSAPVAFTFSAADVPPEPISIEAETIISSGFVVENNGVTSQGQVASLLNSGGSQGELAYTFEAGAGTYDLSIIAHDENDGVSTVEVLVDGVLVETFTLDGSFPSGAIADNNRVSLDVTGLNLAPGAEVVVRAQQGGGEWVRIDTLEFTPVGPPPPPPEPAPPTGDLADVNVALDAPFIIDLDEHFSDINGDALTYSISGPGAAYASLDGSTLTINASVEGDFGLTVIANDGTFDSAPVAFTFSAADVPPEPISIEAETIIASGFVVENHGVTSQGQVASLLNSGNSQGELSYTFEGGASAYDLSIIAHDENDGVSTVEVLVDGVLVETFTLDGDFPSGAIADNNRVSLDVTGLNLAPGAVITIRAQQGQGEWVRIDKLEFTPVGPINEAPVGTPSPAIAATEDVVATFNEADLLANFTDPDGDAMTVESLATDIGQLTPIGNGDWALTTPANFNGQITLTYGVSDGQGNVTPASRTVDVAAVNDAPTGALSDVDVTVDTPLVIDLAAAFSDVESDALTYSISGPGAAYAQLDGATLTINPTVGGAFDITVIANDGTDDSAPVTFTVSATEIPVDTVPSVVLFADELNLTIGARPFETGAGTTTGLSQDGEPALGEASFGVTPAAYQEAGIRYGRAIDEKTGVLHLDIYRPEGSGGDLAIRYSVTNDDGTTSNFTIRLRDDNYGLWTVEGVDTPVRLRDLPADQWHHVTADLTALIGDGATLSSIAVRGDGDGGDTYYLDNVQLTETTAYSEPVHTEIFVSPLWSSAPGAFIRPESAQYDPDTGYVFVSEALPDGQGKVMLLDTDGNIVDPDWLTGLTWPKGLIIENGLVYVATDKDLVVANAATGEVVATYTADAGASLNDVTMAADGSVYVSDLNQAAVWRLKDGVFEIFVSDPTLVSANGIRINDDKLWLATFDQGVLYEIDLETKAISQVLDGVQAFDGVIEIEPGIWLMSSFNGQIRMYNEEDGSLTSIYSNLFNHNAADIGYDPASQTIFVPTFSPQGVFALQLHFPEGAGTPTPVPSDPIEVEAETIIASGFIVEDQGVASEGQVASILNSGGSSGELSYTFSAATSVYDLSVFVHDENDGVSTVEVLVNGAVVETFTLDASLGSNAVADNNRVSLDVAGLALEAGDEVVIRAQQGGGEWVRVDKLVFTPVGGAPTPAPTPNQAPVGTPAQAVAGVEDMVTTITMAELLSNFTDPDGDPMTVEALSTDTGQLISLGNGAWALSTPADFNGTVTLTFNVDDGNGGVTPTTRTVDIAPVNDAPVAGDALTNQTANEGSAFAYSLPVDAFSDVDGDELTLAATLDDDTELPNWLMFDPDTGAFSGTPGQDDVGELTVKVTATDPSGDTAVQTFTLTIGATNDAPVSTADAYSTDEDTALVVPAVGVLTNDSDADDDSLTAVLVSDVSNGALTLNADGSFTYTPNADFTGADSFTYKANDGTTDGNTVTVDITVNAVNDAPFGAMSDLDVEVGVPLQIDLNDYFSDAESDALTYSIAGAGAAVASLEGSILTIAPDAAGEYALTITANDGELDSPPVEITVSSNTSEELVANDDFVSPDQLFSQIDLSGEFFSHLSLRPVSTQLSDGKIAVFWSKQLADFGGDYEYVLVGKILNSDGTTAVPEFQVTPESSSTSISYPQVLSLDDGRVMVAWSMKGNTYTNSSEIKAVIYDSSGAATNTEFVLRDSSESEPSNFKLSILDDGRILATWHEGDDLFARTVSPIGEASGPIIQFSDSEASSNVNISVLSDGGFVFTWTITADAVGGSINERWTLGQVFNADGSSRTSSFIVNDTSIERVYDTRIIGLDNGEFMAVYDTGHTANSSGPIKARIFDADANELVSEFTIVEYEDGSQNFNSWARLENGNIVLAWARVDDNRSGSPYNAELAVYDVNGNRVSPVIPVDEFNSFRGENPSIAALSDGGFAVTYENTWPFNTSAAIRFFDADGTPRGGVYEDDVQIFGVDELLSNDELPANNAVELVSVDNVSSNGAEITLNDNGTITYDPTNAIDIQATRGGVIATDSFSYTIESSNGETSTAIVYLELAGLNDAPEQLLVPTIVGSDETLIPDALLKALIFDVDSEGLRIASVEADQGTLYQSEFNRDWILELPESVQTPVTITYVVWDGHGGETTATLVVDRNFSPELNSAPSVPDDITVVFGEEDYVKFDLRDFVTDADGDPLQFHVEFNSSSIWNYFWEGDLWRDDESHMFEQYDPLPLNSLKANETGNLVFDFIVTDGLETSNGQVTIVFEGENDAPYLRVSWWQPYGTWRGQAFTVTEEDLLSYVKDPDGDVLTLTSAPTMEGAEVTENQDGSWTIKIGEDYWYTSNDHKLAFSVADEHGASGVFEVSRFLSGRPAPTDFVVEAERMTQDGFLDESSYSIASGNRVARLTGSQDQESGTLTYIFSKTPATYDLVLTAFDQYGGAGTIEVRINGELLGTLELDQNNNSQSYTVTAPNLTTLTIAGLELDYDDVIEITGYSDGEDLVHIDKLDFFVVTDPSTSSSDTIGPKADIAASAYELPGTEFDNSAPSVLVQTTPESPIENPRSEVPELTDSLVMPIEDAMSDDQLFLF